MTTLTLLGVIRHTKHQSTHVLQDLPDARATRGRILSRILEAASALLNSIEKEWLGLDGLKSDRKCTSRLKREGDEGEMDKCEDCNE